MMCGSGSVYSIFIKHSFVRWDLIGWCCVEGMFNVLFLFFCVMLSCVCGSVDRGVGVVVGWLRGWVGWTLLSSLVVCVPKLENAGLLGILVYCCLDLGE